MTRVTRRQFLQFSGSALASIGLSQLDMMRQGDRYARVLAQSTPRKLALLVGINQYGAGIPSLRGCLTDVEMQYELLVHRYGFNPSDILIITDETPDKPTRANILRAFEEHLIGQAKPGDVVVCHYSGHGSRVVDPDPIPGFNGLNGTLVPNDLLPTAANSTDIAVPDIVVPDIMGRTLFLLMAAVNTENLTVVLDSCHSGGGVRGNMVVRAIERLSRNGTQFVASPEEFEYQQQWLAKLNWSLNEFNQQRQAGIAKGVALGSAQANQYATDAPFSDFHAGAFTYLLTRYLWQQPVIQPLNSVFVTLARSTEDVARSSGVTQVPIQQVKPDSTNDNQPVYFLTPSTPSAEAVVRKIEGTQVEFWLGGVSAQSLDAFTEGAIFNLTDREGQSLGEVVQTSRVGLVGYGTLQQAQRSLSQAGTFMRERVRGVPADLSLRLGLDSSLGIDIPTAQIALQTVSRLTVVPVNQQAPVDYLLGRLTSDTLQTARQSGMNPLPPIGSIGLFTAGLNPISESFGELDEPVNAAVNRLRSRFKMLLAGRILRLVLNSDTSELKVSVSVVPVGNRGDTTTSGSRGAAEAGIIPQRISTTVQQLRPGAEVQVQVQNNEARNLYIGVLVIGSNGDIVILYPVDWDAPADAALISPGQTLTVPPRTNNPDEDFRFIVQGPSGVLELLVLASTEPLRDALRGLQQIARGRGVRTGDPLALTEDEPVTVIDALLGDFDQNTRAGIAVTRGVRGVDTTKLAAIAAIIEVVE